MAMSVGETVGSLVGLAVISGVAHSSMKIASGKRRKKSKSIWWKK